MYCQVLSCDVYINKPCIEKISSSYLSPWTADMTKTNLIMIVSILIYKFWLARHVFFFSWQGRKGITQVKKEKTCFLRQPEWLETVKFRAWQIVKNCICIARLNENIRTCWHCHLSSYKTTQFCSLLSCFLVSITLCTWTVALRAVNHNFPKELSYRQQPSTLITALKLILFYSI